MSGRQDWIQFRPSELGEEGVRELLEAEFSFQRVRQLRSTACHFTAGASLLLVLVVAWPNAFGGCRSISLCVWATSALITLCCACAEGLTRRRRDKVVAITSSRRPDDLGLF
jgi:hypothetical protein